MEKRIRVTGTKQKLAAAMLAIAVAVGCVFAPGQALPVKAASKAYMKGASVKWDLKKNKNITYKTKFAGIGMKKQTVKMSDYKMKNSKKKGYKELTFTLNFTSKWNMTAEQVHNLIKSNEFKKTNNVGGYHYFAVVDYNTGKNLEKKNKQKVTVERNWINSKPTTYKDRDGCYVNLVNARVKVKVIYPRTYKGLCIGTGGSTSINDTKNDTKFWNGKAAFGKTTFYSKKDKSVAHFMRVTK